MGLCFQRKSKCYAIGMFIFLHFPFFSCPAIHRYKEWHIFLHFMLLMEQILLQDLYVIINNYPFENFLFVNFLLFLTFYTYLMQHVDLYKCPHKMCRVASLAKQAVPLLGIWRCLQTSTEN